jgi:hypothetical protein
MASTTSAWRLQYLEALEKHLTAVDSHFCSGVATTAPRVQWKADKASVETGNIEQLRARTMPSHFGLGDTTVFDEEKRKSLESADVELAEPWSEMTLVLAQIATAMNLNLHLEARVGKLLLYEEGSFFGAHRDSEHCPGHFMSLVVDLDSDCVGGDVVFGPSLIPSAPRWSSRTLAWAAWFASSWHAVTRLERGHRVVLTFDIVATPRAQLSLSLFPARAGCAPPFPALVWETIAAMLPRGDRASLACTCRALKAMVGGDDADSANRILDQASDLVTDLRKEKLFRVGVACRHSYLFDSANPDTCLSMSLLKGRDRVIAEALRRRGFKVSLHRAFINEEAWIDDEYGYDKDKTITPRKVRCRIGIGSFVGGCGYNLPVSASVAALMPKVNTIHHHKIFYTGVCNDGDFEDVSVVVPWPGVLWLDTKDGVTRVAKELITKRENMYGNDCYFELASYAACAIIAEVFSSDELESVRLGADFDIEPNHTRFRLW